MRSRKSGKYSLRNLLNMLWCCYANLNNWLIVGVQQSPLKLIILTVTVNTRKEAVAKLPRHIVNRNMYVWGNTEGQHLSFIALLIRTCQLLFTVDCSFGSSWCHGRTHAVCGTKAGYFNIGTSLLLKPKFWPHLSWWAIFCTGTESRSPHSC